MRGMAGLFLFVCALALHAQVPPDFRRDVEPILAKRCAPCHNAALSQNGVRFDDRKAALAGGYSGPVILPGKPDESKLIQRVTAPDKRLRMPPAGPPLGPAEIAVLRNWIQGGAQWPEDAAAKEPALQSQTAASHGHWSFRPIVRPAPPDVTLRSWVSNPIDRFILARLEREGVAPSSEAPKSVLLRRLSLDLTGLPPAPGGFSLTRVPMRTRAPSSGSSLPLTTPNSGPAPGWTLPATATATGWKRTSSAPGPGGGVSGS